MLLVDLRIPPNQGDAKRPFFVRCNRKVKCIDVGRQHPGGLRIPVFFYESIDDFPVLILVCARKAGDKESRAVVDVKIADSRREFDFQVTQRAPHVVGEKGPVLLENRFADIEPRWIVCFSNGNCIGIIDYY